MECVTAIKGQECACCTRKFKAGELIFEHSLGVICADDCGFTKNLGARRNGNYQPRAMVEVGGGITGEVVPIPLHAKSAIIKKLYPGAKEIKPERDDEFTDTLTGKLVQHINKLGRKAAK